MTNRELRMLFGAAAVASASAAFAVAWVALPEEARPAVLIAAAIAGLIVALQLVGGSPAESAGTVGAVGVCALLFSVVPEVDTWHLVAVGTLLLAAGELTALSCAYARIDESTRLDTDSRVASSVGLPAAGVGAAILAAAGTNVGLHGGLALIAAGAIAVLALARLVGDRVRSW